MFCFTTLFSVTGSHAKVLCIHNLLICFLKSILKLFAPCHRKLPSFGEWPRILLLIYFLFSFFFFFFFFLNSLTFRPKETYQMKNETLQEARTLLVMSLFHGPVFLCRARMHQKVVGNFGSEADVWSLYYWRFRFSETSDFCESTGKVNSNRFTSSLLRKWTWLPTHAYEVQALTFELTDNFESNDVLPCGAYGPPCLNTRLQPRCLLSPFACVLGLSKLQNYEADSVCEFRDTVTIFAAGFSQMAWEICS